MTMKNQTTGEHGAGVEAKGEGGGQKDNKSKDCRT